MLNSPRHRLEQNLTLSQSRDHFFRQENGRLQVRQIFSSSSDFLTIRPFLWVSDIRLWKLRWLCLTLISKGAVSSQCLNEQRFFASCPARVGPIAEIIPPDGRNDHACQQKIDQPTHIHKNLCLMVNIIIPGSDMVCHIFIFNTAFRKHLSGNTVSSLHHCIGTARYEWVPVW